MQATRKQMIINAVACACALLAQGAHATDSFDAGNSVLSMESITVGSSTYKNVAVKIIGYSVQGVDGGTAQPTSFDAGSSVLRLGTVAVGATSYTNARVQVSAYDLINSGSSATAGTTESPNYVTGLERTAFLNTINQYRSECGLPTLAQNTVLDKVAAGVGLGAVGKSLGGTQNLASNNAYAMPTTVGGLLISYNTTSGDTQAVGSTFAKVVLADPYAMLAVARPYSEVGLANYSVSSVSPVQAKMQVATGNQQRIVPAGTVATMPCANTTTAVPGVVKGVKYAVTYAGAPSDATTTDASFDSLSTRGTPIAVMANPGDTLVIDSASITTGGQNATVVIADSSKPMNGLAATTKVLYSHEGFVYPTDVLQANTSYTVTITGKVNGTAFTKTFSFKTGATIPETLS